ncbi:MAG TPA: hypothetical protein VME42_09590 [Steroidobacteraceae bacterium]|nr:hypothetical protein [Steroidobacteraceae bacterium]
MKFSRFRGLVLLGILGLTSPLLFGGCSDSPAGTQDTIVVTPSVSGAVSVVDGGSKSFTLSFNSSDANAISGLSVTSGLSMLPAGWSGPAAFSCTTVTSGSGCVLTLTYAPTTDASGTLTIAYRYTDSAGAVQNGSAEIRYAATAHDTVSATAAPTGQINAVVGASQAVTFAFMTDDGNPATGLTVTNLTSLPSGWTSAADSFTCATVSTGSGCLLTLTFAPSAAGSGTLTLNYGYTDNAGTAKTGTVNVAYAGTVHDNVVGTVSPSGQINAFIGGAAQSVEITFTTDDHNVATLLAVTSDLAALPDGWSAAGSSFSCASLATGNGCQLQLTYAPSAPAMGTLTLSYSYVDSAGSVKNGSLGIAYAATAHNNVVGTASPSGQVNAVIGSGAQSVLVNFTTDSGIASALTLSTALGSLPAGWSSTAASLTCASVAQSGNGCQLPLSYAPTTVGSGTLTLNYGYTDDAGNPETGTVGIPYASTVHDTVSGAVTPSGTVGVAVGASQPVTVIFTTNDGNTAGDLAISASGGLGSLPGGWSAAGGATSFACSSVSTGAGCELELTYAPTAGASGTLTLDFSYLDNAGTAQTGTVGIPYSASAQHAYVSDSDSGLYICAIDATTGTLSNCAATGGFSGAWSVAFYSGSTASYAYVVDGQRANIYLCTVNSDGTLSSCTVQGASYSYPEHLIVSGSTLYVADQGSPGGGEVTMCAINSADGTLSGCIVTASGSGLNYASGIALGSDFAYVPTDNNGLFTCALDPSTGLLTNCAVAAGSSSLGDAWNVTLANGVAYFANAQSGLAACAVDDAGNLSSCANNSLGGGPESIATGVFVNGAWAYVSTWSEFDFGNAGVYLCSVSGLAVSACTAAVSDGSGSGFIFLTDVTVH